MPLIAIPNISASTRNDVDTLAQVVDGGARLLDVHFDEEHARAVFTCSGERAELVDAMTGLAVEACRTIDLTSHEGRHPRIGALDVCPFVPHGIGMAEAVTAAGEAARRMGAEGIPVFLYGDASPVGRSLPEIRAGGLQGVVERLATGMLPDAGPTRIDPRCGAVSVGARDVLIAFNVWIDGDVEIARRIAARVRTELSAVRALGLDILAHGRAQVSMNLIAPDECGIDDTFHVVEHIAGENGAKPVATEIVGLVPERLLPDPNATAARLLIEPGRSLEAALRA